MNRSVLFKVCFIACLVGCGGGNEAQGGRSTTPQAQGNNASGGNQGQGSTSSSQGGEAEDEDGSAGGTANGGANSPDAQGLPSLTPPEAQTGRPLPQRRPMSGSAESAYREGLEAAKRGDNAAATAALQRALGQDPNSYQILYSLGVVADRSGQEERALGFYRRALGIQADYEKAVEGIINIQLRRRAIDNALAVVEPLARNWERNLDLQALYADVLVQAQRYDDAWKAARAALRRNERFVPALKALIHASLAQGRKELADSILEQAIAINDSDAELHFLKSKSLLAEGGRLQEAMSELQKAVTLQPDYVEAHIALGIQLLSGGNYDEAVQHFEMASKLAPLLTSVHLNLGDAYRATKQWVKAKAELDQALRMGNNLPEAHFNLGLMYMSAGEEFPGLDRVAALRKAVDEFTQYRNLKGPRLSRDDPSEGYMRDAERAIEREQRRIERERARAQKEAERAARAAAMGGGNAEGQQGGTPPAAGSTTPPAGGTQQPQGGSQ